LFFERKLQMEGNTEVGLAMRNMLDAIDWDEQPPIIAVPKRLFDSALARSLSS
jgi:predicted lipid carrier protein YhbT